MNTLHRVAKRTGSIVLGELAEGVEFYTADKHADGSITLRPVAVVHPNGTRTGPAEEPATAPDATESNEPTGDSPWDSADEDD